MDDVVVDMYQTVKNELINHKQNCSFSPATDDAGLWAQVWC